MSSPLDTVLDRLEGVESRNGSGHMALCPAHDDKNPSLHVSEGDDGRVLVKCHAGCSTKAVLESAGLSWRSLYPPDMQSSHPPNGDHTPRRSWPIRNIVGDTAAVHHRIDKWDGKVVYWRGPNGEKKLAEVGLKLPDLPLYRSEKTPEWPNDVPVVVVEGEPAADALAAVYPAVLATVTGAESVPGQEALEALRGRKLVLWPDADAPGKKHMERIAERLQSIASEVRVFEWREAPEKGDAADHPAVKSRSRAAVTELISAWSKLPDWEPEIAAPPAPPHRESYSGAANSSVTSIAVKSFRDLPKPGGPRPFTVEALIPERFITTLYGDGGSAKSIFALSIAFACGRGDSTWLGYKMRPCPALFVDFELDDEEQGRRARQIARASGDEEPPEDLFYLCAAGQRTDKVVEAALLACREHEIGLVVIDSVGMAMDGDAGKAQDVVSFFKNLERFRAAGVTLLLVDHQGKVAAGESYQSKTAFGSSYKGHLSRSRLQVESQDRATDALSVVIRQNKSNVSSLADPFKVNLTFSAEMITLEREELGEEELREERTLNVADRLLLAMSDGAAYASDLVEPTGSAIGTVKNRLASLKKRGLVETTGERQGQAQQVRLTEAGERHVERYLEERKSAAPLALSLRDGAGDAANGNGLNDDQQQRVEYLIHQGKSPEWAQAEVGGRK